jgi:peptidoglycan/xylan/chitin deacetylase (PgdA/CDA1 family)
MFFAYFANFHTVLVYFAIFHTVLAGYDINGVFRCNATDVCPDSLCCSEYGYCGSTVDYCGLNCQSNCGNSVTINSKCNQNNVVSLTFDDGPSKYTPQVLKILNQNNIKATFFVLGSKLNTATNKKLVQQMQTAGHTIAIHTMTHPYLTQLNDTEITKEIGNCINIVKSITRIQPKYFRPPYLDYDARVDSIVKKFNLKTIYPNLDTFDWKYFDTNSSQIFQNVVDNLQSNNSYITLQHDTLITSTTLLQNIIDYIKSKNFTFVSMDQCLT